MASTLPAHCHSIPPVIVEGYEPKGTYGEINGLKTYITGSKTATIAIIVIYDVFGYYPQTIQGADLIAAGLDALVVLPDVFEGGVALDFFEQPENEKKIAMGKFFGPGGAAFAPKVTGQINSAAQTLVTEYPSITKIGAVGFCYGGKVVILAANAADSPIAASAQAHPSALAAADAEALRGPHLILASQEEATADVEAFDKVQKPSGSEVHTFDQMPHGWMTARADFKDPVVKKGYEQGYEKTVSWFKAVLA